MKEEFPIKYNGKLYDLNNFLKNHPGGSNYLQQYVDKDVAERMNEHFHSKAAHYLLREYKVDGRDQDAQRTQVTDTSDSIDLEYLVDWNKPMLSQVGDLGAKYSEWVTSPVDRQLRLFENPLLEQLTITPWYVVPAVWLPVIFYYINKGYYTYAQLTNSSFSLLIAITFLSLGLLLWTMIEYSLHRWVFHMTPTGDSKLLIFIHFAIHGLHHKVPFDTRRLVFPPVPAALVFYIIYQVFWHIFPESVFYFIIAGGILGYVIYDMIHFYLHYGSPKDGTYLYSMKRYHNYHHFSHHESGFGISSPLWDQFFGTLIRLRQLTRSIRWK